MEDKVKELDEQEIKLLTDDPDYIKLSNYFESIKKDINIKNLFETDEKRFYKFSLRLRTPHDGKILIDFSKNRINSDIMNLLLNLTRKKLVPNARDAIFLGENVNFTENCPVMHTAFRNRSPVPFKLNGKDIMPDVQLQLQHIKKLYNIVISGVWRGFTNKQITNIVTIGSPKYILSLQMVVESLKVYSKGLKSYFISNADGNSLYDTLNELNYETTLFIFIAKYLKNVETLLNVVSARNWLLEQTKDKKSISKHFIAISHISSHKELIEFGIDGENIFEICDWVNSNHTIWSPICLPIVLAIGYGNFEKFLEGAHFMDVHFKTADCAKNAPVILAMIGFWYNNFFNAESSAIFTNDNYLQKFSSYVQQLQMQSTGKSMNKYIQAISYPTSPIVWGNNLCYSQNSFSQILHQSTRLIPCDFIVSSITHNLCPSSYHHKILIAQFLAQSEALMLGQNFNDVLQDLYDEAGLTELETNSQYEYKKQCKLLNEELEKKQENLLRKREQLKKFVPHRVVIGNKPSNSIVIRLLTPFILGALMALYEHKVYVQSIIWDINAFDSWGLDIGKEKADTVLEEWEKIYDITNHDDSTSHLISFIKSTW